MVERIKLDGKTGQLEGKLTVERLKQKLVVSSEVAFSKRFVKKNFKIKFDFFCLCFKYLNLDFFLFLNRYLKYLTKKFLKKNKLRDWLRVIANTKDSYELRYFNIDQDEDADEEEK